MPINAITVLGWVAGTLTTISFAPQVVKTWKTRSSGDISMAMLLIFGTGVALWLVYGILRRDSPIIAANGVTLILIATLFVLKLRHSRRNPA